MKKITKKQITQISRWSVFVMAALTTGIKIAEVSAYNSFQTIVNNPDVAIYSSLVNTGYLFIR